MQQNFTFVSTVPIRRKRPGAVVMKAALVCCLLVILLGLLSGKSLIAAIGPVGLVLSYLLVRAGGPTREVVNLPVNSRLTLTDTEIHLTHLDMDMQDGRGPRTEEWTFDLRTVRELRRYARQQTLMIYGPGHRQVTFSNRTTPPQAVTVTALHLPDAAMLDTLTTVLQQSTGLVPRNL